jgi:hypothetical protein
MGLFAAIPAVIFYNRYTVSQSSGTTLRHFRGRVVRHSAAQRRRPSAAAKGALMARRGRKLMGEINVVPYIDVMPLLSVIFMITAPLMSQGIRWNCPRQAPSPCRRIRAISRR